MARVLTEEQKINKAKYNKAYREKNKERLQKLNKEYRIKNKKQIKEYNDDYNMKNREKRRAYSRAYEENNKEKRKEYRVEHAEKYVQYRKNYWAANKVRKNEDRRARRTKNEKITEDSKNNTEFKSDIESISKVQPTHRSSNILQLLRQNQSSQNQSPSLRKIIGRLQVANSLSSKSQPVNPSKVEESFFSKSNEKSVNPSNDVAEEEYSFS